MKPHFDDRLWPVIRGRTDDIVRRARKGPAADAIRVLRRILRNFVMRLAGRADYQRWASPAGHETWWDERTQLIASMIPNGARVIEFGCGRRQLEKFLPGECTYVPSDLVERGPGTIVCDLNTRPLPDLGHLTLQVAVFGGVLEYVRDVESVIQWVREMGVQTCVASFDAVPAGLGPFGRLWERQRRLKNGYMNNLTEETLLRCFDDARMQCVERRRWTGQVVYRFVLEPDTPSPGQESRMRAASA